MPSLAALSLAAAAFTSKPANIARPDVEFTKNYSNASLNGKTSKFGIALLLLGCVLLSTEDWISKIAYTTDHILRLFRAKCCQTQSKLSILPEAETSYVIAHRTFQFP